MARRPKEPNHQLDMLITEAGVSLKGLAARVVRLGAIRGQDLRYNHSSVARWIRGEIPKGPVPSLIAEVLAAELGRAVTTSDIGMMRHAGYSPDAALKVPSEPAESALLVRALTRDDIGRRHSLVTTGFDAAAYSSAALRWIVAPRTGVFDGRGMRAIGTDDIEDIREATRAFRVLDNRMGGGRIRPTVVDYLHLNVVPLLNDSRCTSHVRRDLFSAAAEVAQLAGWQAYDLEQHGVAQRYLVQALAMARLAGDEALGGEILAAMSHQAVWVSQAGQGVDLAQAAQAAGVRAALPTLQAESLVMEAHAHALRQDARACSQALKLASDIFDKATDRPLWLKYFDRAYFAARIAHCFRALGQGTAAVKYAERSLDMDHRFVRGKMFNVALLAAGYAVQGEVEKACEVGREAVDRATAIDSTRSVTYIRNLLVDLRPYGDVEDVRAIRAYAESRMPALRRRASRR